MQLKSEKEKVSILISIIL